MKVTAQVIMDEATIDGWFHAAGRDWCVWHDTRARRSLNRPNLVALHVPSGIVVAVYVRPRPVAPSGLPAVAGLPADWLPVCWWPTMTHPPRWLAFPKLIATPGLLPRKSAP